MSRQYLYCGDLHGNMDTADRVIDQARDLNATIVQVGDWSFLWPLGSSADELENLLAASDVQMWFIDGNHDWHPRLRGYPLNATGHAPVSEHLTYMPRGSSLTDDDGTTFLFLGGAPSIDHKKRTEGKSWWPEETITEEDVAMALAVPEPVDVMVTHDAPVIPAGFSDAVGSAWFRQAGPESRARLNSVVLHHRPRLLVHGHWHKRYSRLYKPSDDAQATQIVGLDCDTGRYADMVLPWSRPEEWDR